MKRWTEEEIRQRAVLLRGGVQNLISQGELHAEDRALALASLLRESKQPLEE